METFDESADIWRNPAGIEASDELAGISRKLLNAAITGPVYGSKVGVGGASFHMAELGQAMDEASSTSRNSSGWLFSRLHH